MAKDAYKPYLLPQMTPKYVTEDEVTALVQGMLANINTPFRVGNSVTNTSNNFITYQNGVLSIAGGGLSKYIYSTVFEYLTDRFILNVSGTGANAVTTSGLLVNTGATSGSYAGVRFQDVGATLGATVTSGNPYFATIAIVSMTTGNIYIGAGDCPPAATINPDNDIHFGFLISCAAGTYTISASWNGATTASSQSLTALGAPAPSSYRRYFARMTDDKKIEFFVDGVLYYTATTNLPTTASPFSSLFSIVAGNKTTAANQAITVPGFTYGRDAP